MQTTDQAFPLAQEAATMYSRVHTAISGLLILGIFLYTVETNLFKGAADFLRSLRGVYYCYMSMNLESAIITWFTHCVTVYY